jgi:hypothetical protein
VLTVVATGTGPRGTLTITGTAGDPVVGSFTPNPEFSRDGPALSGPTCRPDGCSSTFTYTVFDASLAPTPPTRTQALIISLTSSSATPPGPAPGENPVFVIVSYAVSVGNLPAQGFSVVCSELAPCPSIGVSANIVARTVTFTNLRLFANGDRNSTRWIEVNGVLTY